MAHNYAKERAWSVGKYKRLVTDLPIDLVNEFRAALAEDNILFAVWLRARINEYFENRNTCSTS